MLLEYYVFLGLATVGGTIMVCQFVLTLVGLGGHGADGGHDVHLDGHHDAGGGVHGEHAHGSQDHTAAANWLFSVISFRTVVAAFTFFGLGGLACQSADLHLLPTLIISLGCGAASFAASFAAFCAAWACSMALAICCAALGSA